MGKKDDAIAGLNALTEKTIENVKLVLNHYGFDSYERKSKVLEEMLNVHRDWDGIDRKTRFEMLAQYFIEHAPKKEDRKAKKETVTFEIPIGMRDTQINYILKKVSELLKNDDEDEEDDEVPLQLARRTKIIKIYKMIKDFSDEELERIYLTLAELHKKYELSDEEKAFRAMCNRFNIDDCSCDLARSIFFAGINFVRNE